MANASGCMLCRTVSALEAARLHCPGSCSWIIWPDGGEDSGIPSCRKKARCCPYAGNLQSEQLLYPVSPSGTLRSATKIQRQRSRPSSCAPISAPKFRLDERHFAQLNFHACDGYLAMLNGIGSPAIHRVALPGLIDSILMFLLCGPERSTSIQLAIGDG